MRPRGDERGGSGGGTGGPDGFSRSLLAEDPVVAALLDEFLDGLPARMAAVSAALAAGALDRVQTLAHATKGATASYGFPGLARLAARLEEAARAGDLPAAQAAAADLASGCAAARAAR